MVRLIQFEAAGSACGVGLIADAKVRQIDVAGVAGTAAKLEAARRAGGCFYSGFTSKCVDAAQAAPPAPQGASVQVLVNLNVRAGARDDADVVGVVPAQTCVTTGLCMTATDGLWCRAKFGERTGWMRKLALRQNRWAIVTFDNSCPKGG